MNDAKQVIVMKKFSSLRTGKYCAQSAHASVGALLSIAVVQGDQLVISLKDPFVREWLTGRFKKIVLYVETDKELIDLYEAASISGLPVALIRDAGLTEFNNIPTLTAIGIGPGQSDEIDRITGHLNLF